MSDPNSAPSSPDFGQQPAAADQPGTVDFPAPSAYDPPAFGAASDVAPSYGAPAGEAPAPAAYDASAYGSFSQEPQPAEAAPPVYGAPDPYAAPAPFPMSAPYAATPYATPGAMQQFSPAPYGQALVPHAPFGIDPISGLPYSDKSKLVAGLLGIFLGSFGVGRFYLGNIGMGIAQVAVTWLTFGLGALWPLIDGIVILAGQPTDKFGRPLRP